MKVVPPPDALETRTSHYDLSISPATNPTRLFTAEEPALA